MNVAAVVATAPVGEMVLEAAWEGFAVVVARVALKGLAV